MIKKKIPFLIAEIGINHNGSIKLAKKYTNENIYLIANWGVIPFWLLLIILPNHSLTNFFIQSIILNR